MKKIIILISVFVISFSFGLFIDRNYFKSESLNLSKETINGEALPANFINLDLIDSLKVGANIGDFMVTNISEEKIYPDGSKGKVITFKMGTGYYLGEQPVTSTLSLYGTVSYVEEMGTYYFSVNRNFFDLPILYFKNDNGYNFIDNQTIKMNDNSGKFLYEYWKENSKLDSGGEIYVESFDIEANKIKNLKAFPVKVY